MHHSKNMGIIGLLFLLFTTISTSAVAAPNTRSALGINSNEVMDDDASVPFIDVFKMSIPFEEARPWLTKGKVEYDKDGWPKKLNGGQAGTRFLHTIPKNTVPEGHYTVLYDGEGKIEYTDDATLVSREKGKDIISIKAGKDKEFRVKLIIKMSNEKNYLRNVRVLMPGGICSNNPYRRVNSKKHCRGSQFLSFEKHHEKLLFNPDYLNYMKDFKVIRFMNMSGITRNPLSEWSKRPQVSHATWGGKATVRGAPLEIMVALANKLNADPWFTLPHKANDDFVRRYAQYVKANLKPNLKAYVEYTNEAWNSIFTQSHYVKDMGERMRLDEDRAKAGYKYFSLRSVQIFDMWEQTFGGTERIVRVMGSWTGWTRMSEMLLSYRDAYKKTDAIAIAPYFFPKLESSKKARSVSQLFKLMYDPKERYSIPSVLGMIHKNAQIAEKFGVDLIAYEGGQHLVDWKSRKTTGHPTKLMIAANRDWRMAKAYSVFMQGWKDNGGKLFVNFSAPRTSQWFGSWGTKEYLNQPLSKAPKHRALMQFKRQHPCWWKGCSSSKIVRLQKPATNPIGDVFALVPNQKKRKGAKTSLAKVGTIGTKVPAKKVGSNKVVVAKANVAKKSAALVTKNAAADKAKKLLAVKLRNEANKKLALAKTATNVAKTIATNKKSTAIWASNNTVISINNKETNNKTNKQPNKKPSNSTKIAKVDGTVHRAKGRQLWKNNAAMRLSNVVGGNIANNKDLTATWQTHWDDNFLYVRVDAVDDKFVRDSVRPWSDDSIELYIDADGSRSRKFDGRNDFHMIYRWKDNKVNFSKSSPRRQHNGIKKTMTRTDKGYSLETAIPWKTLGVKPVAGRVIGIDIQINDDDNGKERDGKLAWHATTDKSWVNPQTFGRLVLGGI